MSKMERWEQKAIGRVNRFENYTGELLTNRVYEGTRAGLNYAVKRMMVAGRRLVNQFANPSKPQIIAGKKFTEGNTGVASQIGLKIGVAAANKGIDMAESGTNAYLTRKYFYPDSESAADALFGGHITFDKDMGREMFNACGYEPGFDRIMAELHTYAIGIENIFTDETWRQKIIPHVLKTAFQSELDRCFDRIRLDHQQHPEIYNRQLMETQMNVATQRLGEIFEKFTLNLANKTDFLEAPLTFLPQKTAIPEGAELTETEQALLAAVPRHSLFANEKELQKRIAAEQKKLPKLSADDAVQKFKNTLNKPVTGEDGVQKPYQTGHDLVEDERRLIIGVLNLREMMQQYEKRNIFSRWLTPAGRAERKAIQEMKGSLLETLNLSAEQLETLLDLKTPLEKHVDLAKAMDILYKPKQEKTFTEKVSEVMEKTNEVIRDVTEVALNTAGKMISTTAQIISNPGQTINNMTETVSNAVNEIGTTISNTMNDVKTVMNEGILDVDFSDLNLDGDMDDLIGFDRNERPEPIKPEPVLKEPEKKEPEPEPEQTKLEQDEEKAREEPKEDASKQEEPQQESAGWGVWNAAKYVTNTVTSTATTAASWLNPFNYSIFGGKKEEPLPQEQAPKEEPKEQAPKEEQKQPQEEKRELMPEPVLDLNDPVTYLQQMQVKAAYDAKGRTQDYFSTFAKLLFYKTLELSLIEGSLPADALQTACSKDSVKKATEKIMKEQAFKNLNKFTVKKGFAKKIGEFLEQVSKDPTAVNEIHKDYMQKTEALKAPEASQPKEPLQRKDPEKPPVVGGGGI